MDQNITQRRGLSALSSSSSTGSASLPLTTKDVDSSGKLRHKRRVAWSHSTAGNGAILLLSLSMILMTLAGTLSLLGLSTSFSSLSRVNTSIGKMLDSHHPSQQHNPKGERSLLTSFNDGPPALPLDRFSSLSYALKHSELVALYFAAQWCPMSTPVSISLDNAFGSHDLLVSSNDPMSEKKSLSIVYVSSDKTSDQFHSYLDNRNWYAIPYESPDSERTQLQKHFSTCAHNEMKALNIDRKHEIPTIIVLDGATHGIITTDGAKDVVKMSERALGHWQEMQQLIRQKSAILFSEEE